MTKTQALYEFFSSFGMDAYPADSVPNDTTFPWLTYEVSVGGDFGDSVSIQAHLYFHTKSESVPNAKVDQISKEIGMGGIVIPFDEGRIWIRKGSPFAFSTPDQNDPMIKHRIMNLMLEYL